MIVVFALLFVSWAALCGAAESAQDDVNELLRRVSAESDPARKAALVKEFQASLSRKPASAGPGVPLTADGRPDVKALRAQGFQPVQGDLDLEALENDEL